MRESYFSQSEKAPGMDEPFVLPPASISCPFPDCPRFGKDFTPHWRVNEHMKIRHGWPRKNTQPFNDNRLRSTIHKASHFTACSSANATASRERLSEEPSGSATAVPEPGGQIPGSSGFTTPESPSKTSLPLYVDPGNLPQPRQQAFNPQIVSEHRFEDATKRLLSLGTIEEDILRSKACSNLKERSLVDYLEESGTHDEAIHDAFDDCLQLMLRSNQIPPGGSADRLRAILDLRLFHVNCIISEQTAKDISVLYQMLYNHAEAVNKDRTPPTHYTNPTLAPQFKRYAGSQTLTPMTSATAKSAAKKPRTFNALAKRTPKATALSTKFIPTSQSNASFSTSKHPATKPPAPSGLKLRIHLSPLLAHSKER